MSGIDKSAKRIREIMINISATSSPFDYVQGTEQLINEGVFPKLFCRLYIYLWLGTYD